MPCRPSDVGTLTNFDCRQKTPNTAGILTRHEGTPAPPVSAGRAPGRSRADTGCDLARDVGWAAGRTAGPGTGVGHAVGSHRDCAVFSRVGMAAPSSHGGRNLNAGGG
jgi:hypothetical protein